MSTKKAGPIACEWQDLRKEVFTPAEITASDIRVELIDEMIKARKEAGVSQSKLAERCGIKQSVVGRLETQTADPKLSTVLKYLGACGKTLQIVEIKNRL